MKAPARTPQSQPRLMLTRHHDTQFVSPAQFCELLLSRRNLLRSDDRSAKIRGLIDPTIGVRFLVKEEELAKLA